MAGIRVENGTSSTEIDVTNEAARVYLYDASGNPLYLADGVAKPATLNGIPVLGLDHESMRAIEVSRMGRVETPDRRILFFDPVEGATLNSQRWTTTATTMNATQTAAGGIVLNGSAITTINTGVVISSRWGIPRPPASSLHFRARAKSTAVTNQAWELGLVQMGTLSGTTALPDNGAYWKFTGSTIVPVVNFSTGETSGTDITAALAALGATNFYDYHVVVEDDRAVFFVVNSATGSEVSRQTLKFPATQAKPFAVTRLNAWARIRNGGSAPASAGQLIVLEPEVSGLDILHGLTANQQVAENANSSSISPTAYTQAAQFANSAAPTSATLSNTAAGYTTLGGLYQWAALVSAATDYCLFGFAVPSPYRLKISGVHISMYNTGAANAATPATTCQWGLGLNGASANLSTGGHIRRTLGVTSIAASAAIGAASPDVDIRFAEPLTCEPGTTLAIIMRVVGGAATASQVIAGSVNISGVFE